MTVDFLRVQNEIEAENWNTFVLYVLSSNDRWPPGVLLSALQEDPRSGIERSHMNSEFALGKDQVQVCGPILTRNARGASC